MGNREWGIANSKLYQIRYRYTRYAHIVETFHETSQSKTSRFAQNGSIVTGFGITCDRSYLGFAELVCKLYQTKLSAVNKPSLVQGNVSNGLKKLALLWKIPG
ncbi:MAG: hypothetical protein F6K41_31355 [Symploca sp. SIO3E6]|nr:hypothetical protein [Caldora sp. SIO3E6]